MCYHIIVILMNCLHLLVYIVVTYSQTFMWYFTSKRFWDSCCYELFNYFFYQGVFPLNFVAQMQKSDNGTVKLCNV